MSGDERERSPELEQLRQTLFPNLPPEEGWARIDEAFRGASDSERWDRIELLAAEDLDANLLTRLKRLRERHGPKL
jgi:hypothetical protein